MVPGPPNILLPLVYRGACGKIRSLSIQVFEVDLRPHDLLLGAQRVAFGLFLVLFICADILGPIRENVLGNSTDALNNHIASQAWLLVIVSFLYTYLNFEGFSAIAIGISKMFGLTIVENFDRPLLVTNIAQFWRRYHISMGNWINQYIYFPVVVWLRTPWAPYAGSIIAFCLFGMWHEFTLKYLVWGLGNGLAVALYHALNSRKLLPKFGASRIANYALMTAGGVATLLYVGWLQTLANLDSISDAWILTRNMIGL